MLLTINKSILIKGYTMKLIESLLTEIDIHPAFVEPVSILISVVILISLLLCLFPLMRKLSREQGLRSLLQELKNSVNHRDGSRPIPIPRWLKKVCHYLVSLGWAYVCIFFLCFLAVSIFIFILRSHAIGMFDTFVVIGIFVFLAWMIRFAFIEAQVAFYKAKSI